MFQAIVLNEILKMNKMSIGKRVKAQSLVSEIGLNIWSAIKWHSHDSTLDKEWRFSEAISHLFVLCKTNKLD